jgi:hypothetical protein
MTGEGDAGAPLSVFLYGFIIRCLLFVYSLET